MTVCDWRGVLRKQAAHGPYQLYHKLDTHWNGDGAMLGYQTLMQTLGIDDFGFAEGVFGRGNLRDHHGARENGIFHLEENAEAEC